MGSIPICLPFMFIQLEAWLISLAGRVPLEIFAPVASFIEEVIPPIPSPAVMIITGSLAAVQSRALASMVLLVVLAVVGKTLGALVVYFVADKVEDLFLGRFAKWFGVSHQSIEAFGAKLGQGPRDYLILTVLRALPIVPSSILSVGCGVLKVPIKLLVFSTVVGSLVRDALYIYFGFAGAELFKSFVDKTTTIESWLEVVIVLIIGLSLLWAWWHRRRKNHDPR